MSETPVCEECGNVVEQVPTAVEYADQEIYLFDPVVCAPCLLQLCEKYSIECVNCGEMIPPYTQVGIHKGQDGVMQFVHMNTRCSTVGSAFHGYWGKGKLHNYIQIEAC
jgi:hypothetical protein